MDFLKVLIAVLLDFGITKTTSLSVSDNGNFTISTATTDWISSCNGRKPGLVNVHWDTLSVDGDIPIPENGSRFWIGYYRQYQYFSIKGCASAGSGGTRIGNVDNPLGHCFYLCKTFGHIGLAGAMCHCLSDNAINALPINNATCSYETCGSGLVCGSNRTMWIYGVGKKNFTWTSTTHDSVEDKCVSLTQYPDGAKWNAIKCSTGYRALCITKDGTVDRNEAAEVRGAEWDAALTICHNKLENLANISLENYRSIILNQKITNISTVWTSFVRDMVIGFGGFDEKLPDLADCAVIYKSDGKIKLDYQKCSNTFLAVCLNEFQSTSTVTSTTTSTTPMTTTGTTESPTTSSSTTPASSISTNLQTASNTKVTNTRTIEPTTSTRHAAAAGNISTDTLASSSIEFGIITTTTTANTTTTSTAQRATGTSSATVFPMAGRIGLGIFVIVVVAGVVVVIKKMTAKRKRRPSTQASAHSHDNKTELPKGIPMLGVNEKEVSSNDDENEIKMKGTSNGCSNEGNVASDPNYEYMQIESNIKHNGPVGNSTGQTDNAHSTNCQYATVVKVGKGSPKITKTTPESDTNTYDTTYVHQEKNRDTGDEYQHIYDHANFKNPE